MASSAPQSLPRKSNNERMLGELIPKGGGDSIPLLKEKLLVGRRESCDIVLRFAEPGVLKLAGVPLVDEADMAAAIVGDDPPYGGSDHLLAAVQQVSQVVSHGFLVVIRFVEERRALEIACRSG